MSQYEPENYWEQLHRRHPGSRAAVGLPALGTAFNDLAYRNRVRALRALLRDAGLETPIGSLLEAAVGVGAYADLWAEMGTRSWVGVDVSQAAIDRLRTLHPGWATFHRLDLTSDATWQDDVLSRTFDLVTLIDVLYHIPSDQGFRTALQGAAERVCVGGLLVVSDVFVDATRQTAPHVRRRPRSDYESVLYPMGFRPAARGSVFAFLAEPLPARSDPRGALLRLAWRALQGSLKRVPLRWRDQVARGVVAPLLPVDYFLSRRLAPGRNLELAAYRLSQTPSR